MARIRTIKPEFWTDERVIEVQPLARLLFIGMWNFADDRGNLENSPKQIKARIFPADDVSIHGLLTELITHGLLTEYSVDGRNYLNIRGFCKHQVINRPSKTHLPERDTHGGLTEDSPTEGKGREGKETTPTTVTRTTARVEPPAGVVFSPQAGNAGKAAAAALDTLRTTPAVGTDLHEVAGELWAVLAANACKGTASHPAVVEMARDGVTVEQLRAAITEARKTKSDALNPAYLAAIVERMRDEPAKNPAAAAWATDERACEAKARELGLWPARSGEDWNGLRGRIRAAISTRAQEAVR